MNKDMHSASSGRVLLLVTKKFAQRVYLYPAVVGVPKSLQKRLERIYM